jgi:hypothetical protein
MDCGPKCQKAQGAPAAAIVRRRPNSTAARLGIRRSWAFRTLLWPKLLELGSGSTTVAHGIHLELWLNLARLGLRARRRGADRHGDARRRAALWRKGELRSTLTRAEGTGVHAGAHRGLGLAGAKVQGGRQR